VTALLSTALPPALWYAGGGRQVPTAYFAVTIDAAVNLREAREYQDLPPDQRLSRALEEQQGLLNQFSDPVLNVALDLRIIATPGAGTSVAIVGRAWGGDPAEVTARAQRLSSQLRASLPPHVRGTVVSDQAAIRALLQPFGTGLDSALITRRELIGAPARPDAYSDYYFSVVPFTWVASDWGNVYAALNACPDPVILSVAVLPMALPPEFGQELRDRTSYYGRLAREDQLPGGLSYGARKLAPDAFAADAEQAFGDFARRLEQRAFALRIQVSAPGRLPAGIVETVAAAISPGDRASGSYLDRERAGSAYDVRRPATVAERQIAEWNLHAVDVAMLPGRPEIWRRPNPPVPALQMLSVIGDARDASCAFRLPVAVEGVVPGFKVRGGRFAQEETIRQAGPAIRIGSSPDAGSPVEVSVRSLTKHALVVGSTGSGKTTTVLEILRQLWAAHRVPFLVIEPVNSDADDYRKLALEPGFEALEVITVGDEGGHPLRFNPFEVPRGVLVGEHMANLLACFKAAFGLWEPLPSIYSEALSLTYLRAGFLSSERSGQQQAAAPTAPPTTAPPTTAPPTTAPPTTAPRRWPTAVEFMRAMREVTKDLGYAGEVKANIEAASIRRAQQLVYGVTASAFLTTSPNDLASLLDHPVILELKALGSGDEQALMMALLLNAITEHYQATRGASADLVHVTVVEEAHRLLARQQGGKAAEEAQAKEKAAEAFANTLAENRKYGEGVIIAEQLLTKLVADAVKNTNLKIMHRLTAEDDRRYLGETTGMDEAQRLFAARLQTGEALLYSDDLAEAAHVKIARTPQSAAPRPGAEPAAAPPFAACDRCRAQCVYRGAALSMMNDPGIVNGITDAGALVRAGITRAEQRAGLAELRGKLYDTVGRFAALPTADPGRSDAAFCLFLHVYASSAMRVLPAWPAIAARFLEIDPPGGEPA
jgi:hypothetical protein